MNSLLSIVFWVVAALATTCVSAGCNQRLATLPANEAAAVSAVAQAWEERGLPETSGANLEYTQVIHTTTPGQFERECRGWRVTAAASCLVQQTRNDGMRVIAFPRVILKPGQPAIDESSTAGPLGHELCHHLMGALLNRKSPDVEDAGHTDPRVWEGAPGATPEERKASVQARYRDLLFPPASPSVVPLPPNS